MITIDPIPFPIPPNTTFAVTGTVNPLEDEVFIGIGTSSSTEPTLNQAINHEGFWSANLMSGSSTLTNTYIWVQQVTLILPEIFLSWSDDKGKTFGNPVGQPIGSIGQGLVTPSWRRLGMARDRVFQLEWSFNGECALNGAFLDIVPMGT